jgi:hypothetical protein
MIYFGTAGNDENLDFTPETDYVFGLDGNDTLNGGDGNDWIDGGTGDDLLRGGAGDDTLTGGLGADWFWSSEQFLGSVDYITDFSREQGDKIVFELSPGSNVLYELSYDPNTGAVSLSGQTFAILSNKPEYLVKDDFGISRPAGTTGYVNISNDPFDGLYNTSFDYNSERFITSSIVGSALEFSTRP